MQFTTDKKEICSSNPRTRYNPQRNDVDNPFAQLYPKALQQLQSQTVVSWRLNPAFPGIKN